MKKYISIALFALLTNSQIVAIALPAHDQNHAQKFDKEAGYAGLQAMRDEMQKKMSSAKTDAERQQVIFEQQRKMEDLSGVHEHTQTGNRTHGYMKGMFADSAEMQKHRKLMNEQMSK